VGELGRQVEHGTLLSQDADRSLLN
jgi:hypothetical protein